MKLSTTLAEIEQQITKILRDKPKYVTIPMDFGKDGYVNPSLMCAYVVNNDDDQHLVECWLRAYQPYQPTYH